MAGRSVSAARTASPTTTAPAMPTERRIMNWKRISPMSPSRTVRPEKKTARPAVATVIRTAVSTAATASRDRPRRHRHQPAGQLLAEAAGEQERVVDPEPEPEQRARLSTKMLIGVRFARPKMMARATTTAEPPTANGTAAATRLPNTRMRASPASGREIASLRRSPRIRGQPWTLRAVRRRADASESHRGWARAARMPGRASGESSAARSRKTMS